MPTRTSVYVDGYAHKNPIPAASRIGNVVYSSIIHGIDSANQPETPGLEQQAELMFKRLVQIIGAAGGTTDQIVKVTMWMGDRGERETVNRFWLELFPDPENRPARQTVNAQLDGGQLVVCDFVAVLSDETESEGEGL